MENSAPIPVLHYKHEKTLQDLPHLSLKRRKLQMSLKRKEKAFVQAIIDNPKQANADAVIKAGYDVKSRLVAGVMGSQLIKKPQIQSALADYVELTESAITQTVKDWKDSPKAREREIAMQNAQYIHDKVFGKSTQKIEQTTVSLSFGMDLSGSD